MSSGKDKETPAPGVKTASADENAVTEQSGTGVYRSGRVAVGIVDTDLFFLKRAFEKNIPEY